MHERDWTCLNKGATDWSKDMGSLKSLYLWNYRLVHGYSLSHVPDKTIDGFCLANIGSIVRAVSSYYGNE